MRDAGEASKRLLTQLNDEIKHSEGLGGYELIDRVCQIVREIDARVGVEAATSTPLPIDAEKQRRDATSASAASAAAPSTPTISAALASAHVSASSPAPSMVQTISNTFYTVMVKMSRLNSKPRSEAGDAKITTLLAASNHLRSQLQEEIKRSEGLEDEELRNRVYEIVHEIETRARAAASSSSPEEAEQQMRDATSASALAAGQFGPANLLRSAQESAANQNSLSHSRSNSQ